MGRRYFDKRRHICPIRQKKRHKVKTQVIIERNSLEIIDTDEAKGQVKTIRCPTQTRKSV